MSKHIFLLGGSGRTGLLVIEKALASGHKVTALVRNTAKVEISHANLTLFEGSPSSAKDLAAAMQGCDSVIVTLNNSRQTDSPFSKIINSDTLLTDTISETVAAMKGHGITRISMLSAAGTTDTFVTAPWVMRLMIKHTNLGHAYRDHEGVQAVLEASGLDWTLGRAMMLGKKPGTAPVIESYVVNGKADPKPAMQISRASVAQWLIDSLDRDDLAAKAPMISQK
ncbi:NAD(P)-binding oxidoreductase [Celeribacter arenosi]|uniref:NAD(P)-binding domain-containing protein n=1 Tax=Celeribacter arenosi TaxID=792649 RepID=A0ABP7JUQ8_9RHOB